MIRSELLDEKHRVQKELSQRYPTARAYSEHAQMVAEEIAKKYGFSLRYAELPSNKMPLNFPTVEKPLSERGSCKFSDDPLGNESKE